MVNETEVREFDFTACPWCGSEYKDRQVVKVQCDVAGPCHLFVECDCGVVYRVERVISWRAEKVTTAEVIRLLTRSKPA